MIAMYPTWMKSSDRKLKKIVHNAAEAEAFQKELDKYEANLGKKTQCSGGKKPDAPTNEPTPDKGQSGESETNTDQPPKPISEKNFVKMSIKELKEYLISNGVSETEVKKFKQKDQLIARIGELGK